jgi:hypothetical protein
MLSGMSRYTKANHRVFMQFVRREVWHVTFLQPGLKTPLPKTLTFKNEGKIRELALFEAFARAVCEAETALSMPARQADTGSGS